MKSTKLILALLCGILGVFSNVASQDPTTVSYDTPNEANQIDDGFTNDTSEVPPKEPAPEFTSSNRKFKKLGENLMMFNELLDKELPPKGYPFPRIHGPAPWERVCIVGAGPAGVHMSLTLKQKGYSNVTIFEKSGRVGGKSFDVNLESGSYHPQGAFVFTSDYFTNLVALAEKYGVGEYAVIPGSGVSESYFLYLCIFYLAYYFSENTAL